MPALAHRAAAHLGRPPSASFGCHGPGSLEEDRVPLAALDRRSRTSREFIDVDHDRRRSYFPDGDTVRFLGAAEAATSPSKPQRSADLARPSPCLRDLLLELVGAGTVLGAPHPVLVPDLRAQPEARTPSPTIDGTREDATSVRTSSPFRRSNSPVRALRRVVAARTSGSGCTAGPRTPAAVNNPADQDGARPERLPLPLRDRGRRYNRRPRGECWGNWTAHVRIRPPAVAHALTASLGAPCQVAALRHRVDGLWIRRL